MPFYETVFETGSTAIAEYADDAEAAQAAEAQHNRAKNGLPGGPTGHVAERVLDVLVYDKHPATFGEDQSFSSDVALKTVTDMIKALADENGIVSKTELASAIIATSDAAVPDAEVKHGGSRYKMKEKGHVALPFADTTGGSE